MQFRIDFLSTLKTQQRTCFKCETIKNLFEFFVTVVPEEITIRMENLMDINIPPAQDSPKNILNALNDDCLQAVLTKLTETNDTYNVSKVCRRFQENAAICYSPKQNTVRINDLLLSGHSIIPDVFDFLNIFGHQIRSLQLSTLSNTDPKADESLIAMIARFCGETLNELKIYHCDYLNLSTKSQFIKIETLILNESSITNLSAHPYLFFTIKNLTLRYYRRNCDQFIKHFRNLEEAEFSFVYKLTDKMLIEFLILNPQLKVLNLNNCRKISSSVFRNIGTYVPNLKSLNFEIYFRKQGLQSIFNDVEYLAQLRNLKQLSIVSQLSVKKLIDALVENKTAIEVLHISTDTSDLGESIPNLKTIKNLTITSISDDMLVDFVKNLPELESLESESENITPSGIKKALEYGKRLKNLTFHLTKEINLNFEEYKAILAMAKNRVAIQICYEIGEIDVPTDVLNANSDWLSIGLDLLLK